MSRALTRSRGSTEHSKPSAVILLSGGLDSAACIAFYRAQAFALEAIFFDYGQAALVQERKASRKVAAHFGIKVQEIRLRGLAKKNAGEVRGRNAVFMLTALMEHPIAQGLIATGIHAGPPYYDCTPAFLAGVQVLFDGYTDGRIKAAAPFLRMTKDEVWRYGQTAGLPMEITYSCERGGKQRCGKCASCRDRRKLDVVSHH
jgi:7-cyano-7-deazaguanine synthase